MDSSLSSSSFNTQLAHAQSTPAGVDGSGISSSKTSPATPKKNGKMLCVRVQMLDDSITIFQVQTKVVGRLLFDQVCKQLNLLEADYFGLEYHDTTTKYWLDFEKPISRQIGLPLVDPFLKFGVKFYTPDPAQLEEEYTRYLFCLQIKRDLMHGDLQCSDNTAALIISYIIQAECGDYSLEDYPDHTYLSSLKFVSYQDKELETKIMVNHKKHGGQSPAEADLNLLETARRCELYGMKMHSARDQEGVLLNLAVAHMGIVVFQNNTKINTFSWAKIRKISFKRKRFLIKLHPEGYGHYKDIVEFIFDNRNQCKSFWKKCVENHGFFRCSYVKCIPRQKARVISRGSSFRYSGRTQKQVVEYVRENYIKRQTFQRSQSFRHQSSIHSSVVNVGASISTHPLLPLGENAIAGSGASLSCGSMTLSGSLSPTTLQDGGAQTAPTVMNQQQVQPQQPSQLHQTAADLHEPATTSSDITSIASQSPPCDTGQIRQYPHITRVPKHPPDKLHTNTMLLMTVNNPKTNTLDLEQPSVADRLDTDSEEMHFNYDIGKLYTEFRFPNSVSKKASTAVTSSNRLKINDPDILRDLIEPGRVEDTSWQRRASCKELSVRQMQQRLSKEGTRHEPASHDRSFPNKLDSFRYCYFCHGQAPVFESGLGEHLPRKTKVYSSSYPGTTGISVESKDKADTVISAGTSPGAAVYANEQMIDNNIENYYEDGNDGDYYDDDKDGYRKVSAGDLSHDSYEILERESAFRSRSSSVDSDDMFIMENDYKSISKHILWKEGSDDVEKRLGYVEPRYRDIDFNQFNEICKRGFALRNRDASQSHGNIKFSEFSVKGGESSVMKEHMVEEKRIVHEAVGRTKSDPYMCGDHKVLNKQKLFGLHQKSLDLATPDADSLSFVLSKTSVDIPYTLRIRNEMNGTARDQDSLNGFDDSDTAETLCSKSEDIESVSVVESKIKSQPSTYASQDSGLSLSIGNDSVDDNEIDLKDVLLTKNYEQVVTTKKSTKLMLSLSEENNENVVTTEQPVSTKQPSVSANHVKNTKIKCTEEHGEDKHRIIKVKSVEAPKKSHSTKVKKSKSAESYERKISFLHADSANSRGKKEIIVIDSDDYHSFDDSKSDKRSDGSDSVLIVEYRGNKRKKLSKKTSSDSRGSQAESEASSFDAPRIKKKDLKKRNTATYFYNKDRIPTIEISEDETYKVENNNCNLDACQTNEYKYSSDERQTLGSDLSKTDFGNEIVADELTSPDKEITRDIIPFDEVSVVLDEISPTPALQVDNVEQPVLLSDKSSIIKVNQDFASSIFSEKSCQIVTKLGLSEGSAIVHSRSTISPTAVRQTKSLDTPIVSLHRLPPITSFSSKDDTVDNEEGVILEEKVLNKKKYQNDASEDPPVQVELQNVKEPCAEKSEIKPKSNSWVLVNRLKSNSIAAPSLRKQCYDDSSTQDNNGTNLPEIETLNKERSKSEGYENNLLKNITRNSPDKKHSTRQERLDSFKKLKNFSIELWESDDVERNRKKVLLNNEDDKEYDDNVFVDNVKNINSEEKIDLVDVDQENATDLQPNDITKPPAEEVPQFSLPKLETQVCVEVMESIRSKQQEYPSCLSNTSAPELSPVPEKRSFDEEPSTSSSIPAEAIKHFPLESSGSSSMEEAILPLDYPEEEMLDLPSMHMTLDMAIATTAFGAKPLSAPFNSGFFSLSRTLSRISERSTTSELEHTDFDDDSTKPLSRSVSIDDSILSSDQHYSISSDPPSGMNLENVFDDDDLPVGLELDQIPPPLLPGDEEWPSRPQSPLSIKTPVIDNKMYSAVADVVTLSDDSIKMIQPENDDGKEEEGNVSEDKTLQDDSEDLLEHDQDEKFQIKERTRNSIGDDTSACITTSDWSSSTGTTIKNAHTGTQCISKSEDNSLTCEYGVSISTDVLSESCKSSTNELDPMLYEKNYLTLDRKQTSVERKMIFFPSTFHSCDDEYDSPYTESEDSPSNPIPLLIRKKLPPPPEAQPLGEKLNYPGQPPPPPPPPPRHYQDSTSSCVQKLRTKVERNRAAKFMPQYTSSSMSTSLESPTSAERKLVKTTAKEKCYSYYSLARSPPSDGSSSSGDLPNTPLILNTIPRVSKRRRYLHPSRRRPKPREQSKFDYSRSSTSGQPFYQSSRRPKY